jgi:hypothetical protein
MANSFPKDILVLLATAVTTVLTCAVLAFFDLANFSLYGFTLLFVIPIGAILAGFAAASGCYLAARLLNYRPTRLVLIGVLAMSAMTFFLVNYLDYYFMTVDGQSVRTLVSFTDFLNVSLSHMSVCLHTCVNGGVGLGPLGYLAAGLQILGFFLGGASVYGHLQSQKYCDRCERYCKFRTTEERYFPYLEEATKAHGEVLALLRDSQFHAALARHADAGAAANGKTLDFDVFSELQLRYCETCLRHHIHVALKRREGHSKNDWKVLPNTEADFETGAQFYLTSVEPQASLTA